MTLLKTIWQRDGELVVAFGPDGEVTLAELRRGSLQLARAMARLAGPDRPGMRWALCFDDCLLFTQALLACALGGYQAILPGHQRLAGLQALQSRKPLRPLPCGQSRGKSRHQRLWPAKWHQSRRAHQSAQAPGAAAECREHPGWH